MPVLDTTSGAASIASGLGLAAYPFTIAAWVRRTGTHGSANGRIASLYGSTYDSYHLMGINTNQYALAQARHNNGTLNSFSYAGSIIASSTWVPVIYRANASNSRDIFKGALANNQSNTVDIGGYGTLNRFMLGNFPEFTSRWLGQMAHVAVWNKSLSDTEVEDFINGGNPLAIANVNLRAYWAEDFFLDTNNYYEDKSGNGYHLLLDANAAVDTTTTGPTIDPPPSTAQPGITITGIKEPNVANEEVTGVTNARVKVWEGTDDTGAEGRLLTEVAITNGTLSTGLSGSPEIDAVVTVEVMWTVGTERKLLITDTTVVDLGA
jgi:hypothetical protein